MRKIEIILQAEKKGFVIKEIEPASPKNMLLMKLKNKWRKNE